jgi:nitrate reductase NapAB chaperone NapD
VNISSVIVRCTSENKSDVIDRLQTSELCEIFCSDDKGKIVVTIESEGTEEDMDKLKAIQKLPGVAAADLMFAYSDDEGAASDTNGSEA